MHRDQGHTVRVFKLHEEVTAPRVCLGRSEVRVFVFFVVCSLLLCGLFGCVFCLLFGRVPFFCCLGGGPHLSTAEFDFQQKASSRPNSFVWGGACFFLCCLGGGGGGGTCLCFLLLGRAACFFCSLGGGSFVFCCLGGCVFIFLLFGRWGMFIFVAVWAVVVLLFFCCLGGVREFTDLPVCLACL